MVWHFCQDHSWAFILRCCHCPCRDVTQLLFWILKIDPCALGVAVGSSFPLCGSSRTKKFPVWQSPFSPWLVLLAFFSRLLYHSNVDRKAQVFYKTDIFQRKDEKPWRSCAYVADIIGYHRIPTTPSLHQPCKTQAIRLCSGTSA